MGLFSKKDACPVCGGEVKGLFLVKIGDKRTLCKNCSEQVSMDKELLKTATPEFIEEHLAYRRENAVKYANHNWTVKVTSITGLQFGLDEAGKAIYLIHDDLHDEDNPVVLSFDQITGYELLRGKKKLDGMEDTGQIVLETGLSALGGVARALNNDRNSNYDTFHIKLTTTDPYWKEIDLKITFTDSQLYGTLGIGGFAGDFKQVCQIIKNIIRKEPVHYIA